MTEHQKIAREIVQGIRKARKDLGPETVPAYAEKIAVATLRVQVNA